MLLVIFALTMSGCPKRKRTADEQLVIDRLRPFWSPLEDYKMQNFTYPDTFFMLARINGITHPHNPYTDQPMVELDSDEFDPDVSPGNIYYRKITNNEGIIMNCQVVIFGEFGVITTYHHSSPLATL